MTINPEDTMDTDEKIIANLKTSGLYEALKQQITKDMGAGDVHVSSTGKDKPKKKPLAFTEPSEGKDDVEKDFRTTIQIAKVDPDQRLIFGWASVSQIDGEDVIDKQGDVIPIEELEKAAYEFMLRFRQHGDMHSDVGTGYAVESMVFTPEKAALGIVAKVDGQQIYGWFVGFKIESDDVWKRAKDGLLPEFSIGGRASSTEE